jgi:mono/diheme cytochrome c family protein
MLLMATLNLCATLVQPLASAQVDGSVLLGELNCTACHAANAKQAAWLSPKVAPRLADIGSRASAEWLRNYLASPQVTMPGGTMPDVLHGNAEEAEALTHYLLVSPSKPNLRRVMPDRGAVARGERLYHSVGCVACHAPLNTSTDLPAPAPLPSMAEKWAFDGLRRFLRDPLASRPSGRMPAMQLTDGEAADLAHYLLRETKVAAPLEVTQFRNRPRSLEDFDTAELDRTGPADGFSLENRDGGNSLRFQGWLRVEQTGDYTFHHVCAGASRLRLGGQWRTGADSWQRDMVDEKSTVRLEAGWHEITVDYAPRGSKPPMLALEWEGPGIAREVIPASRLRSEREAVPEPADFRIDPALVEKGRALYGQRNCAVCHEGKAPTTPAPALAALQTSRGCLAERPGPGEPDFHLTHAQRVALSEALAALNRANLAAPSARQRVAHTMAALNCTACHARDGVGGVEPERDAFFTSNGEDLGEEGRIPPRLDGVGDRLRPAWLSNVLATGASVRPYFGTRMPQFGESNVSHLTDLFVTLDRRAQALKPSSDAADVQRDVGRKLVGTDGLSCVACHRFNRQPGQALQVIDLTTTTERLNEDWFRQFLRDPNKFHPGTRMPALWPDGKSLLPAVLDGDTDRQHAAIWTYLADGPRAKFPEGLSRKNVELIVGGEAVVYRGKLWEAGFRAVAVGYPGGLNAAFDAEEMRLALLWRGRFLNAGPHWGSQGMGRIRPLSPDPVVFPRGPALAILADAKTAWPTNVSKELGHIKFGGYQLDALKRPTLLYSFRNAGMEDFLAPVEVAGKSGLRRTMKVTGPPPDGLHLRLAVGKLAANGDSAWQLNDALTLRVGGGAKAFMRGEGEQQELLVPVRAQEGKAQLEIEYVW